MEKEIENYKEWVDYFYDSKGIVSIKYKYIEERIFDLEKVRLILDKDRKDIIVTPFYLKKKEDKIKVELKIFNYTYSYELFF